MNPSIIAAFKNVFTERYNKINILYYIVLLVFMGIASIYMQIEPSKASLSDFGVYSFSLLIYIILCIFMSGIQVVAVNNGYKEEYNIFPNLFNDFKKILINGLKMYGGFILLYLATVITVFVSAIFIIPLAVFIAKSQIEIKIAGFIIIGLILVLIFLFLMFIFCGLIFNFVKSLEFEDIINVKKAFNFLNKCKKEFAVYILKSILLSFICFLVIVPIFLIAVFAISVPAAFNGTEIADTMQTNALGVLLVVLSGIIWTFFQIDLEIQFLLQTKYIMPVEDPQKDYPETEYIEDYYDYSENDEFEEYNDNDVNEDYYNDYSDDDNQQ